MQPASSSSDGGESDTYHQKESTSPAYQHITGRVDDLRHTVNELQASLKREKETGEGRERDLNKRIAKLNEKLASTDLAINER